MTLTRLAISICGPGLVRGRCEAHRFQSRYREATALLPLWKSPESSGSGEPTELHIMCVCHSLCPVCSNHIVFVDSFHGVRETKKEKKTSKDNPDIPSQCWMDTKHIISLQILFCPTATPLSSYLQQVPVYCQVYAPLPAGGGRLDERTLHVMACMREGCGSSAQRWGTP